MWERRSPPSSLSLSAGWYLVDATQADQPPGRWWRTVWTNDNKPLLVLSVLQLAALLILVVTFAWQLASEQNRPFDPLGSYPIRVVATDPIRLGEDLVVTAIACTRVDEEITVETTQSWVSVNPPGTVVDVGTGLTIRQPGCTAEQLKYPMPVEVVRRIGKLVDEGHTETVWRITGTDTPLQIDGRRGMPRTWTTEEFTVVVEDAK